MAEQNRDSSMEEILSSIKRIIAEDKAIDVDAPVSKKKPALKAVPDLPVDDETTDNEDTILELTNRVPEGEKVAEELTGADGDKNDLRQDDSKEERLIDEKKLDSMRQSLTALVAGDKSGRSTATVPAQATSLEDLTRDLMRPMIKQWLDDNLPTLVEELVAREIKRLNEK